jgi:hypothetical protein
MLELSTVKAVASQRTEGQPVPLVAANCELFLRNFIDPYGNDHTPKYTKILVRDWSGPNCSAGKHDLHSTGAFQLLQP